MDYLNNKQENKLQLWFNNFKERSRSNFLSIGYDFVHFKHNFKKDISRLKYRLPSITL